MPVKWLEYRLTFTDRDIEHPAAHWDVHCATCDKIFAHPEPIMNHVVFFHHTSPKEAGKLLWSALRTARIKLGLPEDPRKE